MPKVENGVRATGAKVINVYGDKLPHHTGRRGANISSQRIDDLDHASIEYALKLRRKDRKNFRAIDLGCGDGIQGVRFSLLGYESHLYDKESIPKEVLALRDLYPLMRLRYHRSDLSETSRAKFPTNGVDICYSQRFIHYLRYGDAESLLARVVKTMTPGGHLFISASGLNSEIGEAHPERTKPARNRFASIDPVVAERHSIYDPICVYSAAELEKLCNSAGFLTIDLWESSFGNIKGVFSKEI